MDQKVTPDVLSFVAECIENYLAAGASSFTIKDIWETQYFEKNVQAAFNKPAPSNTSARSEYDKFLAQPINTLAYAGILERVPQGRAFIFKVASPEILHFVSSSERNAFAFLSLYIENFLEQNGILSWFEEFKEASIRGKQKDTFADLKKKFTRFIIGNTQINGRTEVGRIFPKILNVYAARHNIHGTVGGHVSKNPFYRSDLLYNRINFRDLDKMKTMSRQEASSATSAPSTYAEYAVSKAMRLIREKYSQSEVRDSLSTGDATQVHHILPRHRFPQFAHYPENLIKLTAQQHYTKAHPNNSTQDISAAYQQVCLLAKLENIKNSLATGEVIYDKQAFIQMLNEGLEANLAEDCSWGEIKEFLLKL